ncbi:MAG: tetratricopeptide repeat protein, partial [Deltaproteobacteria bacterium]|nr:tetratricopeptide repeat protein [Deltaproteobacteria bacterium]
MNVQGKAPAILTLALLLLLPCARPQAQPARQQAAPPLAVAAGQPDPSRTLRLRNRRLRQAEEQLRGLRQRQAETLSKMLELAEQDAERLAILFALAALYQEGAELAEQAAGTFADEQTQGAASGEQLRPEQSMVRLRQEAVACRSEALAALDRVRRLSSEPAVVAEAASQRAALLIGQGQQDEAREQYREALAAAPSSPQGRDAALHLGNEALGSGRLEEAQQLFQQVLDHGGVTTDDLPSLFASWGIGSCHFRRKQLPQATATFSSLLLILQRTRPGSTLFEKVRSSYLRALAEGSSFDEAWTQLVQLLGEQTASAQLPDLAESYQSLPRYEDALLAWKMLLGRAAEPARQLHCRWRILQDLAALGRDEEALGELPEALERSKAMLLSASLPPEAPAIGEPAPVQLAGPDLQLLAETRDLAEKVAASLLLARVAQVESPGGLAEPAVRSLAGMLQSHAEIFPGSARRRSLQLGQGTALYLLGSLIEAARHFDEVFAAEGDSELGRQAGLKAVLALGQALQQLPAEGRGEAEAMARRILAISDRWLAGARPANEGAALVSLDRARALRLLGQDE